MVRKCFPIAMAAALAALIVGGVSAASSSGERSQGRDFTALDITVNETDVDVDNSNSFTLGDEFISQDVLKNRAGTKTIGSVSSICTVVEHVSEENATIHCVGTAKLRGGTLELAGLINFAEPKPRVAITGGTGRYDTARGQVSFAFESETEALLRFDID